MNFVVWIAIQQDGFCKLLEIEGVERAFELDKGKSRAGDWPDDAFCAMSPRARKDVELADCLFGAGALVISGKLKAALEGAQKNRVEFLPLSIKNHKGRIASKDYFVVNPQDTCDCIDDAASGVEINNIDPTMISSCESLVLREAAIPEGLDIFRLERWRRVVIVRRRLADALKAGGFSGLYFSECAEYNGLY